MTSRNEQSELEKQLAEFVKHNFGHIPAEEFFKRRGEDISKYQDIHFGAGYVGKKKNDDCINKTKLKLAQRAVGEGCKYVTDLDFCAYSIEATGWKLKV